MLALLTPILLMGQSHMKRGMKVGNTGNEILVDSIIEFNGATQLYYGGVPYEAVNQDSLINAEAVGSSDRVVVSTDDGTQGTPKGTFLADVYSGQQATNDSLDDIRTDLNNEILSTEFDSIVLSDDQTKVYGYWESPTGIVRVIWDVEAIDDPTLPFFVSAVVQDANPDRLLITMSEYMLDSVTEYTGGAGAVWPEITAAYNFDESSGNLLDRVGSDHGTTQGTVSQGDSTGIAATAYYLDGATGYVALGTGINYGTNDLSGSVWIFPHSLAADFRIYSAATDGMFLYYNASQNGLGMGKVGDPGITNTTDIDLTVNVWNHVCWSYDQAADQVTFWINSTNTEVETYTTTFGGVSNFIGSAGGAGSFLSGLVDDMFLWDGTLMTQNRVDSLYNSGIGRRYNESGGGQLANQDTIKNAFVVNTTTSGNLTPDSVYILNEVVRLDLPSPVIYSDVVTVAYNQPTGAGSTEGLRDTADNYTLTWTAQAVTNNVDTSEAANVLVVKTFDYTGEPLGAWTEANAATYYGTVNENNAEFGGGTNTWIVTDTINGVESTALRIRHQDDTFTYPQYHGAEVMAYIDTNMTEAYLSYHIKYSEDFQSLNNGKMPGIGSLQYIQNPRKTTIDGFLGKLQMKRAGYIDTYHFDDTHWDYQNPGPANWVPWGFDTSCGCTDYDTTFVTFGSWHQIDIRIMMNTYTNSVSDDNGIFEVAQNGHIIFQETGIAYHDIEADTNRVTAVNVSSFWNQVPTEVIYTYLDNFKVYIPRNSPKLGLNEVHTTMWDSPNSITEDFYKDDSVIVASSNIQNPAYPLPDPGFTNYRWLVDAGVGNTVTLDWQDGSVADGNYVVIYNGATVGSRKLVQIENDPDLSNNANVVSTGRYMYIYYTADEGGGSIINADISFAP